MINNIDVRLIGVALNELINIPFKASTSSPVKNNLIILLKKNAKPS